MNITTEKQIKLQIFLDAIVKIINNQISLGNYLWLLEKDEKFTTDDNSVAIREGNHIFINSKTRNYTIVFRDSNDESKFLISAKTFEEFIIYYLKNKQNFFFGDNLSKKFSDVIKDEFKLKNINYK